jgi:CheY-like chemotaxis protein
MEEHETMTPTEATGNGPLVLVVDDDPSVRDLVIEVLTRAGFRTATASDGEEVPGLAERHQPAVIVMDVMMPRLDGYTALTRLNGHPATRHIPVVTLTGWSAPIYHTLSLGVGARAHLTKPFSGRELLAAVREVLA